MKPLSSKFASLGRSGIARRVAVETTAPEPAPSVIGPGEDRSVRKVSEAVKRSRAKSTHYRDYQRDYMRDYRARKAKK